MFLLLILIYWYYCWGIWCVWLSSLGSGLSNLVFSPVELVASSSILPVSLVASCQIVLSDGFFREVFPVGCWSSCWFTPGIGVDEAVGRSPLLAHCDRVLLFCSDRRFGSRQLSRQCVALMSMEWLRRVDESWYEIKWSWMKSEGGLVFAIGKNKKIIFFLCGVFGY